MIQIAFSSSFKKAFSKFERTQTKSVQKYWDIIQLFIEDPFAPQLKTHKLSGKLKDMWSLSIEYDIGVVFYFEKKDKVVFTDIGKHDEVY